MLVSSRKCKSTREDLAKSDVSQPLERYKWIPNWSTFLAKDKDNRGDILNTSLLQFGLEHKNSTIVENGGRSRN
jgi:hypothetical protein